MRCKKDLHRVAIEHLAARPRHVDAFPELAQSCRDVADARRFGRSRLEVPQVEDGIIGMFLVEDHLAVVPDSEGRRCTTGIFQGGVCGQIDRRTLAATRHRTPLTLAFRVEGEQASCAQEPIERRSGGHESQPEDVAPQGPTVRSVQAPQRDQVDGNVPSNRASRHDAAVRLHRGNVDESAFGEWTLGVALLLFLVRFRERSGRRMLPPGGRRQSLSFMMLAHRGFAGAPRGRALRRTRVDAMLGSPRGHFLGGRAMRSRIIPDERRWPNCIRSIVTSAATGRSAHPEFSVRRGGLDAVGGTRTWQLWRDPLSDPVSRRRRLRSPSLGASLAVLWVRVAVAVLGVILFGVILLQ